MTLKEQLTERLTALRAKRVDVVKRQTGELATLDTQISATETLLNRWDSFTVDEALAALKDTGVRLRLDS